MPVSIFGGAVTKFNDYLLINHAMTQSGHSSLCPDSDYYYFFRFEKKNKKPVSQINIYYRKITFVQNFNHLYVFRRTVNKYAMVLYELT